LAVLIVAKLGGKIIATAESCTGGQMAAALTGVAGSSNVYVGGVVAYADRVKVNLLDVSASLIAAHGVVSAEVAEAMAIGAKKAMGSDYALSSTGFAGPSGGNLATPVGTVFICLIGPNLLLCRRFSFAGSRFEITQQAVVAAFNLLLENLR
jgi:nicotinamide-nucleotide amidase